MHVMGSEGQFTLVSDHSLRTKNHADRMEPPAVLAGALFFLSSSRAGGMLFGFT